MPPRQITHRLARRARLHVSFVQRLLLSCLFLIVPLTTVAQGVAVYQEEGKLIRANDAVTPLSEALFGDEVNLYTDTFSFVQTDVSLPGGGPSRIDRPALRGR